jgi:hypothetical protein
MGELMHIHAGEDRGGTLLGADEIKGKQHEEAAEHEPGQELPDRNGSGAGNGCRNALAMVIS